MTRREQIDLIKDTLETALTVDLPAASLDNFDKYDTGIIVNGEIKELIVYMNTDTDTTDKLTIKFIIRGQLPGIVLGQELDYHDVVFSTIRELITASLIGETDRDSITGDAWPQNDRNGSAFIDYDLTFSSALDDCDD